MLRHVGRRNVPRFQRMNLKSGSWRSPRRQQMHCRHAFRGKPCRGRTMTLRRFRQDQRDVHPGFGPQFLGIQFIRPILSKDSVSRLRKRFTNPQGRLDCARRFRGHCKPVRFAIPDKLDRGRSPVRSNSAPPTMPDTPERLPSPGPLPSLLKKIDEQQNQCPEQGNQVTRLRQRRHQPEILRIPFLSTLSGDHQIRRRVGND